MATTQTSFPKTPQTVKCSNFAKSDSISKVRVIVRVRPFLTFETQRVSVVNQESDSNDEEEEEVTVHLKDQHTSRNECYNLDSFFGQEDNNVHEIFTREVRPLIPGIFNGCKATVFAYGATGSGKTYTMQGTDEMPGLMPLAMSSVLSVSKNTTSTIEISYYEVYMDRCYDLLEPKIKEIAVLDDKNGQIHLKGLSGVVVKSMSEFHDTLFLGTQRRKVAHTGLNDVSSRSHGVLVISVSTPCNDASGSVVTGKLNLIDLAGNEDNRRTLNEGIRLQESAKINQSLFALSNVIYALNNSMPRVPYRESKLTRILQDSLGGNSRALMVACLNPGEYQESVHTVSLAARSRHISNFVSSSQKQVTPQVRVDMEEKLRVWLKSKGKSKDTHKMAAFGSPFFIKTPSSTNPIKKLNMYHSSAKSKPMINNQATNFDESSPIRKKFKAFEISPRKVLSPVNSNVEITTCVEEQEMCSSLFEAETPKTPFAMPSDDFEFQTIQTPLDRFNALSNNLKASLTQEYVDFLNTASQEELMELKGIGLKLADYIVELRETSPLRSLNDLKKLGLSTKQVHNMFSRAAKGIFG